MVKKRKLSRPGRLGMYVILLVDDDNQEAKKAIKAVEKNGGITSSASISSPLGSVSNIEEAKQHLDHPEIIWDGLITDLYLTKEPLGLDLVLECRKRNIPCVVCTNRYNHADSQWWYKITKELGADLEVEKDWEKAVKKLVRLIKGSQ